jgi:hypothetical protein
LLGTTGGLPRPISSVGSAVADEHGERDGDRDVLTVNAVDDQFERLVHVAHDELAQAEIHCIGIDAETRRWIDSSG